MTSPANPVAAGEVVVESSPLRTTFVRSHSRFVLSWTSDGALEIKYHRGVRAVAWVLCILGWPVLVIGLLTLVDQLQNPQGVGGFVAVGLLLLWGGSLGLMGVWLFGPRYRFDVADGLLTVRHFWRTRRRALAEVTAVQMIDAGWFGTSDEGGDSTAAVFRSYQLNLVLNDPDEPRMFVAYNSDLNDMARKAKLLADFLGVPLSAAPEVHELLRTYAADPQGAIGAAGRFRGNDALRPVSDRRLPEPYQTWIDESRPLPPRVRILPRSVSVFYELGLFVTLGFTPLALIVLIVMMFGPALVGGPKAAFVFVGGVCFLLALIPWYLLRRLSNTIGAWLQLRRGTLRQGIFVGPEGVLVRMEPNRCQAIPLDRFVAARVEVGLLQANAWSRHQERPDFVIETQDGPTAFFLDWSSAPPEQLNQWVAEVRSASPTGRGPSR